MIATSWVESPHFLQVMELCQANNHAALNRVLEEHLATAAGSERAFWLRMRADERARDALLPHLLEAAWADLEEALRIDPTDPENSACALASALGLCLTTERTDRIMPVVRRLRRFYQSVEPPGKFWQYMGCLHMKQRRWHQAARAFGLAIRDFHRMPPNKQELFSCRLAHFHAWRAINLVGCHRVGAASADVMAALSLAASQPPQRINHIVMAMAKAELALHEGRLQDARSAMQQGLMMDAMYKRPKQSPSQLAQTELMAARIARAEGNEIGFAHYCQKALAICGQYRLPLTEAHVQAVMAGSKN